MTTTSVKEKFTVFKTVLNFLFYFQGPREVHHSLFYDLSHYLLPLGLDSTGNTGEEDNESLSFQRNVEDLK